MAKKGRKGRRRASRYKAVTILEDLALGALAAGDVIAGQMTPDLATERYYANSIHATYTVSDEIAAEGPLDVWVGISDLSAAEVEAFLEQTAGFAAGNITEREINSRGRFVKHVGVMPFSITGSEFNDGKPVKTKLGFYIQTSQSLKVFVRNLNDTVLTTGAILNVTGILHGNFA